MSSSRGGRRGRAAAARASAERRQKETAKKKEALMRNKRINASKSSASSSEMSSRGIRERTKWRKRRLEKMAEEKRILEEAELEKKKIEDQKKKVKKQFQLYDKILFEAATHQKEVESILFEYRSYKNVAKEKIQTESNDIIQIQKSEKQYVHDRASHTIRNSEVQLYDLDKKLAKTKQMREEYARDLQEKWYVRLWKFLY